MTDDYTAWLDEHLGAMIRYHLQLEPQVAAGYARTFQGDPVGSAWLGVAAEAAPGAADAGDLAVYDDSLSTDAGDLAVYDDSLPDDLDPLLRSTVEELLPHLSAEDRTAVLAMDAEELAAAVEEARAESNDGLVPDLPSPSADAVLTDAAPAAGEDGPDAPLVVETILPDDADPLLRITIDGLAPLMTEEDKAEIAAADPEELAAALEELRAELAAEA